MGIWCDKIKGGKTRRFEPRIANTGDPSEANGGNSVVGCHWRPDGPPKVGQIAIRRVAKAKLSDWNARSVRGPPLRPLACLPRIAGWPPTAEGSKLSALKILRMGACYFLFLNKIFKNHPKAKKSENFNVSHWWTFFLIKCRKSQLVFIVFYENFIRIWHRTIGLQKSCILIKVHRKMHVTTILSSSVYGGDTCDSCLKLS